MGGWEADEEWSLPGTWRSRSNSEADPDDATSKMKEGLENPTSVGVAGETLWQDARESAVDSDADCSGSWGVD
jgi:hypothetical protein